MEIPQLPKRTPKITFKQNPEAFMVCMKALAEVRPGDVGYKELHLTKSRVCRQVSFNVEKMRELAYRSTRDSLEREAIFWAIMQVKMHAKIYSFDIESAVVSITWEHGAPREFSIKTELA